MYFESKHERRRRDEKVGIPKLKRPGARPCRNIAARS
ncbi:hypothetical protein SNOG_14450 [Parastagonospora nodorum SN15]|uniref:Uncharacterized protein n=1 Tax=Phaeosphaeria nodorum (strain SN15 / ATCC MYA-4574 / FGSC 10173) TaxID=321614 RepID=Q0U1S4_PHANO|nr:hypothetical protein SNOG_14450 [Parastagonospora nodorum SN15]EAT78321.1 hypothetical protein SNOG_14450 [Parastagonospora nodorum SN15]